MLKNHFIAFVIIFFTIVPHLYGATVVKTVKKKYVLIDGGTNDGFKKKSIVCFFNANGKRLACGKVAKAAKTKAYVRVKKNKIRLIKKGLTAQLYQKNSLASKTVTANTSYIRIVPGYVADAVTPVSFNHIIYTRPFNDQGPAQVDSFWDSASEDTSSLTGFSLSIGFDISSFQIVPGARYRGHQPILTRDLYDQQEGRSLDTLTEAQGLGGYLDFYYYKLAFGNFSINFGTGLDVDISDVKITGDFVDEANPDTAETYYSASSSLTTISLRNNILLDFLIDPLGFQLGVFVLLPVSSSQSFSAEDSTDPFVNDYLKDTSVSDDIKATLDHRVNTVGAQLFVSTYLAF